MRPLRVGVDLNRRPVTPQRVAFHIPSAVTGRDLQASAQREDGWCESLRRGGSVAREPAEMKREIPVSFRRMSPLSLVESVSSSAEQTKSGGTASFRPDTKGRFFLFSEKKEMQNVKCKMQNVRARWETEGAFAFCPIPMLPIAFCVQRRLTGRSVLDFAFCTLHFAFKKLTFQRKERIL